MVARASRYYSAPFKGCRGVMQGFPLSPKLFNAVMDAVIRHCLTTVAEEATGMEVFNHAVQSMASFLYMYDSLLASTRPEWMQCVFNFLVGAVLPGGTEE